MEYHTQTGFSLALMYLTVITGPPDFSFTKSPALNFANFYFYSVLFLTICLIEDTRLFLMCHIFSAFSLKDERLFFVAALATSVQLTDHDGILQKRRTVSLITRNANSVMQQIHNSGENAHRMPLMLAKDMYRLWLSPDLSNEDYKMILDFEMPSDQLEYYTVDTIRSPKQRSDGLEKDQPFIWQNVPEIMIN